VAYFFPVSNCAELYFGDLVLITATIILNTSVKLHLQLSSCLCSVRRKCVVRYVEVEDCKFKSPPRRFFFNFSIIRVFCLFSENYAAPDKVSLTLAVQ